MSVTQHHNDDDEDDDDDDDEEEEDNVFSTGLLDISICEHHLNCRWHLATRVS